MSFIKPKHFPQKEEATQQKIFIGKKNKKDRTTMPR